MAQMFELDPEEVDAFDLAQLSTALDLMRSEDCSALAGWLQVLVDHLRNGSGVVLMINPKE